MVCHIFSFFFWESKKSYILYILSWRKAHKLYLVILFPCLSQLSSVRSLCYICSVIAYYQFITICYASFWDQIAGFFYTEWIMFDGLAIIWFFWNVFLLFHVQFIWTLLFYLKLEVQIFEVMLLEQTSST
jgi:hypothetical protein